MSYNGSGTFNINSAGQPVVSGTVISSTAFNALTADLATGLTTALTKDGQTTPTANITLGGYKITNLAAGTAAADAVRFSQLQGGSTSTYITAAGADTITGTVTPTLTAYTTGQQFSFVAAGTNTTAVTLNIDGVGVKSVTRAGTTALAAGDILTGQVALVEYDGTQFQLLDPNAFTNLRVSGTLGVTGAATLSNLLTQAAGADIASAATINLSTATGNGCRITGTTAISAVTMTAGQQVLVVADGALPLTYNATTNKLNSAAASVTLAAGDMVLYSKDLSGIVHGNIIKADGTAVVSSSALVAANLSFVGMWNGTIVASRATSAETIAIKTYAGTDPTASDPVTFIFRNATAGTGDYVFLQATAALSITISSGSTLGMTNSVLARIWLTVFNDASTLRLGVVNCLSGTSIMALKDDTLRSSTAEGGAGGADSAQVIYTGTAVTTKAIRTLGYLEYTLAAVGTWGTAPSKIQLFGPGVQQPGTVVQQAVSATGAVATGTTTIPNDDTIPQITEGDQYLSQAITPTSAANVLIVEATLVIASGVAPNNSMGVALFQDATANALAAVIQLQSAANRAFTVPLKYSMLAGTVAATTLRIRAGIEVAGTTTFNGDAGARKYGGVLASRLQIQEVMA